MFVQVGQVLRRCVNGDATDGVNIRQVILLVVGCFKKLAMRSRQDGDEAARDVGDGVLNAKKGRRRGCVRTAR